MGKLMCDIAYDSFLNYIAKKEFFLQYMSIILEKVKVNYERQYNQIHL